MIELVKNILGSPVGSATFVASLILGGGWLVHYITKKVTEITCSHSTLSKTAEKIEKNIDEIRKDISFLKGSLDVVKQSNNTSLTQAHSPISLTEKGKAVAIEINAEQVIANNWEKINAIIEAGVRGKNPYDIQVFCIEEISVYPEKFFLSDDLGRIKLYAYNSGEPLTLYTRMIAVIVRDRYFLEHKIETSEIDKYAPTQ